MGQKELWNDALYRLRGGAQFYLSNRSRTLVRVKKGLKFTPDSLFRRLQRVGFPLKFVDGLDAIHFTVIPGKYRGWYHNGVVWVDVSSGGIDDLLESFVHEVGHFVDDEEGVSDELDGERKRRYRRLLSEDASQNAGTDASEYLSAGFELFYSEDPRKKKRLRKHNPQLYRTIRRLHRQFRSK